MDRDELIDQMLYARTYKEIRAAQKRSVSG